MRHRFVDRVGGKIVATYARPQREGHEAVPDSDAEVVAFMLPKRPTKSERFSDMNDRDRAAYEVLAEASGMTPEQFEAAVVAKMRD